MDAAVILETHEMITTVTTGATTGGMTGKMTEEMIDTMIDKATGVITEEMIDATIDAMIGVIATGHTKTVTNVIQVSRAKLRKTNSRRVRVSNADALGITSVNAAPPSIGLIYFKNFRN